MDGSVPAARRLSNVLTDQELLGSRLQMSTVNVLQRVVNRHQCIHS